MTMTFDDFLYQWVPQHSPYKTTLISLHIKALNTGQIVSISFTKTNSMGFQTSVHDTNLPCVQGLKSGKFPYDNIRKYLVVEVED